MPLCKERGNSAKQKNREWEDRTHSHVRINVPLSSDGDNGLVQWIQFVWLF